jgi:hypothetical protein
MALSRRHVHGLPFTHPPHELVCVESLCRGRRRQTRRKLRGQLGGQLARLLAIDPLTQRLKRRARGDATMLDRRSLACVSPALA